jgi:MFS family permease
MACGSLPLVTQPSRAPRTLPRLSNLRPGAYYGWTIAVALCVQSSVVMGVGFYGIAVLLSALCDAHGWSRSEVSLATTLYFFSGGPASALAGRVVERFGARACMAAGSIVMALALVWVGRVEAPGQLLLAYPLLSLGCSLSAGVPSNALVMRWFLAKRSRAMSIAHTGVSIGGVVLVPLATQLILREGLEPATRWLAGMILLAVLPTALFVLRAGPEEHGLEVDGDARAARASPHLSFDAQRRHWTAGEALRSPAFWVLALGFGGILFCQLGVAMHQISLLRDRLGAETAALALSTSAFGSLASRLVVGSFADRVGKRGLALGLVLLQSAAYLTFAFADAAPLLLLASLIFGFAIGNLFMLQPLLVGELFGVPSFATVLGLLQLVTQTLSGLGPLVLGRLAAGFGSYTPGLLCLGALALASALFLYLAGGLNAHGGPRSGRGAAGRRGEGTP